MATLAVAMLMLVALTTITLYAARALILEQRIVRNDLHAAKALEAAQAGVDFGLAYLNANRSVVTTSGGGGWGGGAAWVQCPGPVGATSSPARDIPCGDGETARYGSDWLYRQNVSNTLSIADPTTAYRVHFLTLRDGANAFSFPLVQIVAEGRSDIPDGNFDSGRGRTVIQVAARGRQLFRNVPPAPLLVDGDIEDSNPSTGPVSIWGRFDGLGPGVPFSIWASGEADPLPNDGSNSNQTCTPLSYPTCTPLLLGTDIVEGAEIPNFPSNLFRYVFGVSSSDAAIVQDMAHEVLSNCHGLSGKPGGLYWITGDCELSNDAGSVDEPLMLIVQGDFETSGNVEFFGSIYILPAGSAEPSGTFTLNGALIVDGDFDFDTSALVLVHDATVLANLNRVGGRYAGVPGSWNDAW